MIGYQQYFQNESGKLWKQAPYIQCKYIIIFVYDINDLIYHVIALVYPHNVSLFILVAYNPYEYDICL